MSAIQKLSPDIPTIDAETFWRHACWAYLGAAMNGANVFVLWQLAVEMYAARAYLAGTARHAHTGLLTVECNR